MASSNLQVHNQTCPDLPDDTPAQLDVTSALPPLRTRNMVSGSIPTAGALERTSREVEVTIGGLK